MGLPKVIMTKKKRRFATMLNTALYFVCILPSVTLLTLGLYIKLAVEDQLPFLTSYDEGSVPSAMIAIGVCSIVGCFCGIKLSIDMTSSEARAKLLPFYFLFLLYGVLLYSATVFSTGFCIFELTEVSRSVEQGLIDALNRYKTNGQMKKEMDFVQIEHSCCGVSSYVDWFATEWLPGSYLVDELGMDRNETQNATKRDSVPFSCCDPMRSRPCIHDQVHDNKRHSAYDYRRATTLHELGCKESLSMFFSFNLAFFVGGINMILLSLQMVSLIVSRLLQTSLETLHRYNLPNNMATFGWLLGVDDGQVPDVQECFELYDEDWGYNKQWDKQKAPDEEELLPSGNRHRAKRGRNARHGLKSRKTLPKTNDNFEIERNQSGNAEISRSRSRRESAKLDKSGYKRRKMPHEPLPSRKSTESKIALIVNKTSKSKQADDDPNELNLTADENEEFTEELLSNPSLAKKNEETGNELPVVNDVPDLNRFSRIKPSSLVPVLSVVREESRSRTSVGLNANNHGNKSKIKDGSMQPFIRIAGNH